MKPEAPSPPRSRCVFTSAGDRNAVAGWLPPGGTRGFDLCVAYYGEDEARFAELSRLADRAWRVKGGKAQNLRALVLSGQLDLSPYTHVWLPDDDLLLDPADIPRIFDLAEHFGFAVCQPAFDPLGRVTWPITAAHPARDQARLTDYVEMTCPLFRREDLDAFLAEFDGSLSGWGLDLWFAHVLGADTPGRFGILDAITVFNPHHRQKPGGGREIDRLRPGPARIAEFRDAARRFNLPDTRRGACFGSLPLPPGWRDANPPAATRHPHPSDGTLTPEETSLLAAALGPAPPLVLQWGLNGLTAGLLRAGAAMIGALDHDWAWLRSCRADPVFASAEAAGRLLPVGGTAARPPYPADDALLARLRALPDGPALLVAPAARAAPALDHASRVAAATGRPPPARALLTATRGRPPAAPPGWSKAASAGHLLLLERQDGAPPPEAARPHARHPLPVA